MKPQQIHFHLTTATDGTRRLEAELLDDVTLPAGAVLRLVVLGDRATVAVVSQTNNTKQKVTT